MNTPTTILKDDLKIKLGNSNALKQVCRNILLNI